jgi:hypothetical protein
MTPQDNDVNKPRSRRSRSQDRWGTAPILLGAAVVIIFGIWLSTGGDRDAHPVTGGDAPAGAQPAGK